MYYNSIMQIKFIWYNIKDMFFDLHFKNIKYDQILYIILDLNHKYIS